MPHITLPLPILPRPPTEAHERLREEQPRGLELERAQIDEDAERTIVTGEGPTAVADQPELIPGSNLAVAREVPTPEGPRLIEERFVIKERISSERNIAGDVFRASRFWGDQFYGDVVLKKPKSSLRASALDYARVCRDLEREEHCLFHFDRHPSLLSPAGPPFQWDGELMIQTQYLPWSIHEYLSYFTDERSLTRALVGISCQSLAAIEHLAQIRDEAGPFGYAHVDLKSSHLRMDYRERGNEGDWVVVIIDLDSVLPVGPVHLSEAKYNRACVDPEKFMALHDPAQLCTVDPCETVYALGLTLLRVLAEGLGLVLERRRIQPVGLATGPGGETIVLAPDALRAEIERTRGVDRRNFTALFWANRERRLRAGLPDVPVPPLEELLDDGTSESQVVPTGSPPGWSVRPDFFLALGECLRPRDERMDQKRLQALFARLALQH
jgi:hypothetical protein